LLVPRIKPTALIVIHNLHILVFLQHQINSGLAFLTLALIVVVDVFPLSFPFYMAVRLLDFFGFK
jgi:hypothetical protein